MTCVLYEAVKQGGDMGVIMEGGLNVGAGAPRLAGAA